MAEEADLVGTMGDSISDIFNDGLGQFSRILASGILHSMESDVPHTLWEDELGRLRVWAANIGAHKRDQSSLEYRLRDASPVKEQTVRLLQGLRELFDDLEEVLAEPAPEDDSADDEFGGMTELQQMHRAIVDNITCLYQMSMAIRRPAQHDRILGSLKEDAFVFEFFDRQHVSNKFPRAEPTVIERLGVAISRRRATFRYRERHHAKLGQGVGTDENDGSTKFSETVATEYSANPIPECAKSDAGISQTSYGQTLFESRDRLTIPSQPKESADGRPFECPYCYFIITVKDRNAWARHIFHDLLPYMCVFPDCDAPGKLFSGRREWFQHIKSKHWSAREDLTQVCPLCQDTLQISQFQRHLGRHLEELALFALPHQEDNEAEESGEKMVSDDISNSSSGIEDDDTHKTDTWMDRVRDNLQTTPPEPQHDNDNLTSNTQGGRQSTSQPAAEFLPPTQPPKQTLRDPTLQHLQEADAMSYPSAETTKERWIGKHFLSPRSHQDDKYAPPRPPRPPAEIDVKNQWLREGFELRRALETPLAPSHSSSNGNADLDELAEDGAKVERHQGQQTSVLSTVDDLPAFSTPISPRSAEEEFNADGESPYSQRHVSYREQRRDEADEHRQTPLSLGVYPWNAKYLSQNAD